MSEIVRVAVESNTLTAKQEALITTLLSGLTLGAAASHIRINERTGRRWLKLPHVQVAYKVAQKVLFDQALSGLLLKVDKAINCLDRNMDSEDAPASAQIRAAQIIIEQALSIHKMSELEEKVANLERILHGKF